MSRSTAQDDRDSAMSTTTSTTTTTSAKGPQSDVEDVQAIRVNENVTIFTRPESDRIYPPPYATRKCSTTRAPATYDKVALVSLGIGAFTGVSLGLSFVNASSGLYMLSIASFHFLEFWVTARYNPKTLGMHSFSSLNGPEYALAHAIAVCEYLVKWCYYKSPPQLHGIWSSSTFGCVAFGQFVRSGAMISAASSFNHYIQHNRRADHRLVKTGFYAYVRHPSYSGYFLWTLALQMLSKNWVSMTLSSICLCVYFCKRLQSEEAASIRFFGSEYTQYIHNVWSGIPFRR